MSAPLVFLEIDCKWSDERCAPHLCELPEEIQQRAARYLHPPSRRTLIATRVRLAQVLSRLGYTDRQVRVAGNGRPYLEGSALEFNLTHSHERAVLAISRDPKLHEGLGVDLEWLPRPVEVEAIGRRFFTSYEHSWVGPDRERFFHIWTRKEAVLKSNGVGLRVALDSFEVLQDQVEAAVTGRPLQLSSQPTEGSYLLSWAVAETPSGVHFLKDWDPDWMERVQQILGKE